MSSLSEDPSQPIATANKETPASTSPLPPENANDDTSTTTDIPANSGDIAQTDKPVLYSTEHFKIRIGNIHRHSAHSQIKQKLLALKLKPKKIKKMGKTDWAFATFGCEEDRQEALTVLNGLQWRGMTVTAKKAEAAADPLLHRKRRADESHDSGVAKQQNLTITIEDYKEKLLNKTCPLWKMSYEEQLKHKEGKMRKVLQQLKEQMMRAYKDSNLPKSEYPSTDYSGLLLPIKPSPQTDGYRNKCEFTVGHHPISRDVLVGYRLGEYKEGTVAVLEPTHLPNTSQSMKDVASNFQQYVCKSTYAPFDPVSQQGHWMWLLVRETTLGGLMVMPTFVEQSLSQEEIDAVQTDIKRHYTEGDGKCCGVTSLYITIAPLQKKSEADTAPPTHLFGSETIEENLLGLKFQISPSAFFQVNKQGAEVLYSAISEFAGLSDRTSTVLDVCCGTGTIGMLLASHAKSVIGIELVSQAVLDAEKNSKLNGVGNISFKCGKAEAVLPNLMHSLRGEEPLAIVDPPRAGLNREVLSALRNTKSLTRLVYVSCEPQSALKNFVELMRPASKRWKGEPFRLVKLLPVDMFPFSQQCELVLLFERDPPPADDSD